MVAYYSDCTGSEELTREANETYYSKNTFRVNYLFLEELLAQVGGKDSRLKWFERLV